MGKLFHPKWILFSFFSKGAKGNKGNKWTQRVKGETKEITGHKG